MSDVLKNLISSLDKLQDVFTTEEVDGADFLSQYGWEHSAIDKNDLVAYIDNFAARLVAVESSTLDAKTLKRFEHFTEQIETLTKNSEEHFINTESYIRVIVPNIIITLNVIFAYIEDALFGWDYINDNKMLPKTLTNRLKSADLRINNIEASSENIEAKIRVINDAHEAAESLPTDLKELRDTHQEIKSILAKAKKESEILSSIVLSAQAKLEETINLESASKINKEQTDVYVEQCDEALQITTTQGLAAGFDQKAQQLNKSIWVWIGGLLLALCTGAWLGYLRVGDLTIALTKDLTTGQAILHTVMSVFSIGGPLWLAWISTQQIMQRFKLAEDYAYKATVAKSYTGFSKHAGKFDDQTAERLFNSTLDRLDEMPLRLVEGKDYNSPWHEFIDSEAFKKALAMVPELANSASRFAANTKLKGKPNKATVAHIAPKDVEQEINKEETAA
ncbi:MULTISPECIES: hypothetical protein [Vibrio]|uniref:Uncharacterized protein n=1 Tax=Vibrio aestuarianus TaxID=28171 RepID=A0A9X4FNP3_9VIBR|nr:hypothetical protein [Vibrio aestuarianus]MDE1358795.1 hypothetical protein [Vibrio aestuarianus]